MLKLKKGAEGVEAEEVWYTPGKEFQNHHGGVVLLGDYLYCGNGHNKGFPVCVEFMTGKIVWDGGRGAGSGSAAIVAADGHVYFRYQDGTMALVEATPAVTSSRALSRFRSAKTRVCRTLSSPRQTLSSRTGQLVRVHVKK